MSPEQADKLIAEGKPVRLYNTAYDETFTVTLVRRDRFNVYGDEGQVFDRAELEVAGAICITCGTTITEQDTSPCDVEGCPIPMPPKAITSTLRGEFVRIEVAADVQPGNVSSNPFAQFHAAMVSELARIVVPKIGVNPLPEEFEDVADYLLRVGRSLDRMLKEIGAEVNRNSLVNLDVSVFDGAFVGALDGMATFVCDEAARAVREEHDEIEGEARRGHLVDDAQLRT